LFRLDSMDSMVGAASYQPLKAPTAFGWTQAGTARGR